MWDEKRYDKIKKNCEVSIDEYLHKEEYWIIAYAQSIVDDDFEASKAISEVLIEIGIDVKETHIYLEITNR